MNRKEFIKQTSLSGTSVLLLNGCNLFLPSEEKIKNTSDEVQMVITQPKDDEDIFEYIKRIKGSSFDLQLYQQILGSANAYKEGDATLNIAAENDQSRKFARALLANTRIKDLNEQHVYKDEILELILNSTQYNERLMGWTMRELKEFMLVAKEEEIKEIMPGLSSDIIACLVKLMTNKIDFKIAN